MNEIARRLGMACLGLSLAGEALGAPLQIRVLDAQGTPLPDAVVTLAGERSVPAAANAKAVMDQVDQSFVPHVLAVRRGTSVSFPNRDDIRHQVYSFSPAKRFELRLYHGTPSDPVVFDKAGLVVLGCNIHDWMVGYIYVTDDPWFAVSDAQGTISLDVPPGRYQATLWHPGMADTQTLDGGALEVSDHGLLQDFTLGVGAAPSGERPHGHDDGFGEQFRSLQH